MQNRITRWIAFVGGVALLLILSIGLAGCGAPSAQTAAPTPLRAQAQDVAVVMTQGNVVPAQHATVAFKTGGRVVEIAVHEGDTVKQGAVLARLDDAIAQKQIAQAQAAVALAQSQLVQLKTGGTPEQIAAAQATLDAAQKNYDKVRAGPTADELAQLKAQADNARAVVDQAQAAYDRIGGASNPQIAMTSQSAALQQATNNYRAALAAYDDAATHPTAAELAAATAQVQQAQDTLARLKPTKEALAVAQAQVDSAQTALDLAKSEAADYVLVAPFDGVLAAKNIEEGQVVQPGTPAFDLGDPRHLQVETKDVTEVDVAMITTGQTATVTLDALPGKSLKGQIVSIAPEANDYRGDQVYKVTIDLSDASNVGLRWGMTANVSIPVKP